ncbi:type I-E CRISPR-associated protein Cas6/Cse3/CasE [Methylomagnum ishizawai]|uniref:type I-E CRISPR-associated protein Cas6/Cse3/CasE n=1 Tax=Methylomagnum ishizawai TaxID=1760988 RepID=UPI001C3248C9|nr:type I-E CRISPR-associated protein Cas6/Cse3/CasE [Methylomagnum ishizawai]BBL76214.1 CRISPR-associated protein Cse3 [Methylomagnum ishizawai]
MNPRLYMLNLDLDTEALIRFAQDQGLNHGHDEDLGYAAHAWLAACFGELAPKPFRLLNHHGPHLRLLAYSEHDSQTLLDRAAAAPEARKALHPTGPVHAALAGNWRVGDRLDFELLACPVTRRDQSEKDVYLRRLENPPQGQPPPERGAVYRDWLAAQLAGAADLESFRLEGFHLVRILRRTQATATAKTRTAPAITRPRALCRGGLRIADPELFQSLLKRGIGRHRAFGYGMLLLRPGAGIS